MLRRYAPRQPAPCGFSAAGRDGALHLTAPMGARLWALEPPSGGRPGFLRIELTAEEDAAVHAVLRRLAGLS